MLIGRYGVQQPQIEPAARRLSDVSLFAGLPPARLEAAMQRATTYAAQPGAQIIRQGDEADYFYVIDEGEVEVTQTTDEGGTPSLLRRMGPGEVFGEIGLLSRVPRTATVTALTPVKLARLDKTAFLDLVAQGPGLTYALLDLHRGGIHAAEA